MKAPPLASQVGSYSNDSALCPRTRSSWRTPTGACGPSSAASMLTHAASRCRSAIPLAARAPARPRADLIHVLDLPAEHATPRDRVPVIGELAHLQHPEKSRQADRHIPLLQPVKRVAREPRALRHD